MSKWPKAIPALTPERQFIADDFMHYWHEVLRKSFSLADRFGHEFVARTAPPEFVHTLEVGVGIGEHLAYASPGAQLLCPRYSREHGGGGSKRLPSGECPGG